MGQLTNQFVSQSYQGLLNLANANTGFTTNLQTITDGLGGSSPLQMSQTQVNISGTFTVNGAPVSVDTGSLVTTSSFNAYTSSVDLRFDGIELETGSLQNQINGLASTGSLTSLSSSIAVTDLAQNNRLTSLEGITGSLQNQINQKLDTGSFNTYTSSVDTKLAGLDIETGSLQNQIDGLATTGSLSGYTTVTAFNNYTSSNDSKVNSLIAGTGSYATTSSLTSLSQSIATTDLNQNNVIAGLATTSSLTSLSSSIASTDLSQNNRLTALEGVTGSINRNGLITTGSIGGTQSITGSLNVGGTITATSASFTYVNTVYETASVIYSSGSNQLGDASNDTQTLWGTVNLPSGPLVITGSVTATNFTGSLQGTASYAIQALSASYAPQNPLPSGVVSGSQQIIDLGFATTGSVNQKLDTGSFNSYTSSNDSKVNSLIAATSSYVTEAESGSFMVTGSVSGNVLTFTKGNGSTFDLTVATGSGGGTIDTGSFATTGSNVFRGNQVLTGSFSQTGSMTIRGNSGNPSQKIVTIGDPAYGVVEITNNGQLTATNTIYATSIQNWNTVGTSPIDIINTLGSISLIPKTVAGNVNLGANTSSVAIVSGSMDIRGGSLDLYSNGTTVNTDLYLTNSVGGQSNIIKGWGDNPTAGGAGTVQANYTGSLRITGSNNTVSMPLIRATGLGGGVDQQGYISGSENTIAGNNAGIYLNTGSLLFPKMTNNYVGNSSAISMNFTTSSLSGGHPIFQNNTLYAGQLNINSNSGSVQAVAANLLNGGNITSNQNFVTNVRPSISVNFNAATVTLNHLSGSISYQNNWNNAAVTINNALSSSGIVNNGLLVQNNTFLGGQSGLHTIFVSGSQSGNNTRTIVSNLLGGTSINVSSSIVSSSNAVLASTIAYGNNLHVSASHTFGSFGGSAFFGRFNDTGSLALAQDIVFAVGTGTAVTTRRTGLYVTSGSLVGVSGSMDIKGVTNALVVTGSQTIQHSVAGQPALTLIAQEINQPALTMSGSLNVSGSGDHTITGNSLRVVGQTQMSGNSNFPLYVSGTIQTQRLHFDGNPFNASPASNLGAIRYSADNQTFQYTNYDKAEITSQSFIDQYVNTGSLTTQTRFGATYGGATTKIEVINNNGSTRVDVLGDAVNITGSLNIAGLTNSTGSYFLTTNNSGLITRATPASALPLLFAAGAFYSTGSFNQAANVSSSFVFDTSLNVPDGVSYSGSRVYVDKTATYNIQFSTQINNGSSEANVAVWLKKDGVNVADTATLITVASNHKDVLALNLWDSANSGSYYELAYQSDTSNTTFETVAATGNIPRSPAIILTINQVR